ncbi:MAG: cob(I)yrinic acid a,c-diamide adenosyltransferase [Candidatus Omnitrophota bacterium]|nr:cob(I)yrinic acid a,c-diamide adenosyltransferase [Candidatus Omnitrophota bacterium]
MSITTKRGDNGYTALCAGPRVRKDDLRIEALGFVDELSSFLGLAKSALPARSAKFLISSVQKDLFMVGAEVAAGPNAKRVGRISPRDVARLEKQIAALEKRNTRHGFIAPGENLISATFDVARAISRRLERRIVTLKRKRLFNNTDASVYCNRLSDLLFLLARSHEKKP